jgi:uncharacterized alkaline shock family protein YloU
MAEKTRAQKAAPASGTSGVERDRITVTDGALSTLIGLAAHEVPGIIGMAPANLREGIKRILGKQQADEGVEITRQGETASVDLYVAVAYGVNIPAVAESVRERVLYAARAFAGVEVQRVAVHIAGVGRAGR